ncbi:DUF4326 domain-containing protein [Mycolicibacterium sphagni]|uniref:DUF4326 domain-containing protein n=1 Tax=Mycolicibacterium sphagni TaxID=1786 RepID=A0A255DM70_9MYCO|nr:DUF4326 domain-containing protein [Mycolicibacterium sphagni]OYN80446.1 hypothetical protein CG716_10010 [Mycolicibacterium sphagni]
MPERVQRRRVAGQPGIPPGAKYVGRPSRWGNPWRIYRDHHIVGPRWHIARNSWAHIPAGECIHAYVSSSRIIPVSEAVDLYRTLLQVRLRDEPDQFREWLKPLRGRDLACWCPLDQPCHADILLEIANA